MKLRNNWVIFLLVVSVNILAQQSTTSTPAQVSGQTTTTTPAQVSDQTTANPPAAQQQQQSVITENGQQYTVQQVLCPKPQDLVKNGLFWGTPTGGWKSYGESFDTAITAFIGAQWVGVNVGKMICIYKGNLALAFPIMIQNDILTQAPTGGIWGKDLGGYRNCHSGNITDCPFTVKTQVTNFQQIYDSLDFFKGKPNPLENTNNNGSTSGTQQ